MVLEFLRALLLAALPVGLASYFLFSWVLRRRQLGTVTSLKQVEQAIKRQSKERTQQKNSSSARSRHTGRGAHLSRATGMDLVHNKWLAFGGGFMGGQPADVRRR
jgi:hypothetical protein